MKKIVKFECSMCGDLFNSEEECLNHENRHQKVEQANQMLDDGYTLQEIQDICNIWYSVPEHLKNANKDSCFVISYWQGCNKPAYRITYIYLDGKVKVWGCGSWSGYYGHSMYLSSHDLLNIHSKDELFIDSRFKK